MSILAQKHFTALLLPASKIILIKVPGKTVHNFTQNHQPPNNLSDPQTQKQIFTVIFFPFIYFFKPESTRKRKKFLNQQTKFSPKSCK
jgi:hypothetical protein